MILVRLLINGLTLILVAVLVPNINFVDRTLLSVALMAVMLGILNAFVKPIIQFLTLPFIFATYGFVIVLINTVILLLLDYIFEERFYVGGLLWAIVGGLVMGLVASFLESLMGLTLPIAPKSELPHRGGIATPGATILDGMLAGEAAEEEEPVSVEDGSELGQAVSSSESGQAETAGVGEVSSEPTSAEEQASLEAGDPSESETQDNADDDPQGTE
jgi:putative membrane protein